jgi:aminomethyltransferase
VKDTPLTSWHRNHGGKLVEFGGYWMPLDYGSIVEEHLAVRQRAGLFDVSHMGEFLVEGVSASPFLDHLLTNPPSRLNVGQALYSPMCLPTGGTVDDLLVYRLDEKKYLLVVNAANIAKDWDWVSQASQHWPLVTLANVSDTTALLALQGPQAQSLLQPLASIDLNTVSYYHFSPQVMIDGVPVLLSRTGYTGEEGFELYLEGNAAPTVWQSLIDRGAIPVGLGARDTLRLEARLPLYGHELLETITPLEAGLGMFVRFKQPGDFIGRGALERQKSEGLQRKLVGLTLVGGIARAGYPVMDAEGNAVGIVTSGTHSPSLKKPIALALVALQQSAIGTPLSVEIRGKMVPAQVVATPFYRRGTHL